MERHAYILHCNKHSHSRDIATSVTYEFNQKLLIFSSLLSAHTDERGIFFCANIIYARTNQSKEIDEGNHTRVQRINREKKGSIAHTHTPPPGL